MRDLPPWRPPPDLTARLGADEMWEDERYAPIRLLVGRSRLSDGRLVTYWQLELFPGTPIASDPSASGSATDGYEMSERCLRYIGERDPSLAEQVRDDSERTTCVLWTDTEADGEALMALVWSFVFCAA